MSIEQHLKLRHCQTQFYHCSIDEQEGVATFLLFDLSGRICGYQQYRPTANKEKKNHPREGRYFTYKSANSVGVFGLETWDWSNELFITEGIFDAVRLHNFGFSAIATLSNDPKQLKNWLKSINRPIFAVCDFGSDGRKLAKYGNKAYYCQEGKDLGAMTVDEICSVISFFI